jgi:hypothetical protein
VEPTIWILALCWGSAFLILVFRLLLRGQKERLEQAAAAKGWTEVSVRSEGYLHRINYLDRDGRKKTTFAKVFGNDVYWRDEGDQRQT